MKTPQACLEAFFRALASKNLDAARACVLDAKADPRVDELLLQFPSAHPALLQVQLNGDTAEATFRIGENQPEPWHCRFKRFKGEWFLHVERSADELLADRLYEPQWSFDPLLAWFVYPDRFDDLKAASRNDAGHKACVSNVRILTHLLWNVTTSGEVRATEENWREVIRPILPAHPNDRDWFNCPVTGEPYSVNIAGLTSRMPNTPLIYEGRDRKLSLPHLGKSAVGFSDGIARLVGPDEELSWP
jgi:hypothetical protein